MLGNYYYLRSLFKAATREYEAALDEEPGNISVQKRLMVCYVGQEQLGNALSIFLSLVEGDFQDITQSAELSEDCPYQKLLLQQERQYLAGSRNTQCCIAMGILAAFHDLPRSIHCFEQAVMNLTEKKWLDRVLHRLYQYNSYIRSQSVPNNLPNLSDNELEVQ